MNLKIRIHELSLEIHKPYIPEKSMKVHEQSWIVNAYPMKQKPYEDNRTWTQELQAWKCPTIFVIIEALSVSDMCALCLSTSAGEIVIDANEMLNAILFVYCE